MLTQNIELGCGLIGIGRPWPTQEVRVPTEQEAFDFLATAFAQSIQYFDTAPAYGLSEERLGTWLKTLTPAQRDSITVATKLGEHWSMADQGTYVDHTFDALQRSLNQSLQNLGRIDVLQLHKTNPEVLQSSELQKAWQYAESLGIHTLGASVSDETSAEMVVKDDLYSLIQLPFNQENPRFSAIIQAATAQGKTIVTNRPFNMGTVVNTESNDKSPAELREEAYAFILSQAFHGYILTGTKSPDHLRDNLASFQTAQAKGMR